MQLDWTILRSGEQIMYRLRGLYERYGYRRFKMSKFEEYDLYVRNKDFLVSDRMITFTGRPGDSHGSEARCDLVHYQKHPGGGGGPPKGLLQ